MQRPRNHQGRPTQTARGRGRGQRPAYPSSVPNISQVTTGAAVSIVLKVDQPTGREVQGFVAEVLTSGNHPRGIKVRLVDGRVGRVQRMVSEEEARAGSHGLNNLGRNGEQTRYNRYQDARNEPPPPSGYSLSDLLPANHPLNQPAKTESNVHVCPVCENFRGDELAVSHHVNSHFD